MFPNPIGSKIELHGAASMKAIDEEKAFYANFTENAGSFEILTTKPVDWNSKWDNYYIRANGWYQKLQKSAVSLPTGVEAKPLEFKPYTYYKYTANPTPDPDPNHT